jgi:hypothetical protein
MPNHLLIYVIVALNALCQAVLIFSLKKMGNRRFPYIGGALLLPVIIALAGRIMAAAGIINPHLVQQSQLEHLITQLMGVLLIAGPWLITAAAILHRRKQPSCSG